MVYIDIVVWMILHGVGLATNGSESIDMQNIIDWIERPVLLAHRRAEAGKTLASLEAEIEVVDRALSGDKKSQNLLVDYLLVDVVAIARKFAFGPRAARRRDVSIEDVVQDCLSLVWQELPKWTRESRLAVWGRFIARSGAINAFRSAVRRADRECAEADPDLAELASAAVAGRPSLDDPDGGMVSVAEALPALDSVAGAAASPSPIQKMIADDDVRRRGEIVRTVLEDLVSPDEADLLIRNAAGESWAALAKERGVGQELMRTRMSKLRRRLRRSQSSQNGWAVACRALLEEARVEVDCSAF